MTAYSEELPLVGPATEADATEVHALTREVFTAYADVEPQPSSLRETVEDVARDLAGPGGLVVREDGRLVAAARFSERDGGFWLRRVAVLPQLRGQGIGGRLLVSAEQVAVARGHDEVRVGVRLPLTEVQAYWRNRGFRDVATHDYWLELARPVALHRDVPAEADMVALGRGLAGVLRAGDLVVLTGDLGAGKTTLTRGLGEGLQVRGPVTSPTFVIARVHPSTVGGPALVHVDAYRLGSFAEVDDLDLDASLEESVTVVEWGEGKVEALADSRLEVVVRRSAEPGDEGRAVTVRALGPAWSAARIAPLRRG